MNEPVIPSLAEVKHKLERLKALDQQYLVYGAQKHQYESFPLSNTEVEKLEGELGVRLPEDYRQFLQLIGYGAGPYYGLYSPDEILHDLHKEDLGGKSSAWPPKPGKIFPVSQDYLEACIQKKDKPWVDFQLLWPANGCIPICFERENAWVYIVTDGELVGSIIGRGSGGSDPNELIMERWCLECQPPSIDQLHMTPSAEPIWGNSISHLPTFLDWYNAWLDQCLADFEELNRRKNEFMDRDEYIRRFNLAAKRCREYGQQWVIEQLPEKIKFDITLYVYKGSFRYPLMRDGRVKLPWGGRLIKPEEMIGIEYIKARKMFWVDGRVPIWIDFNVSRIDGDYTVIKVRASDRLTNDDSRLGNKWEGNPPFKVSSPEVPGDKSLVDWNGRFSLLNAGKGREHPTRYGYVFWWRDDIAKAVKIYRTARMDDDEIYKRLVSDGIHPPMAARLVEFLPLAYGRIVLAESGAKFNESYKRMDRLGHLSDEQPLTFGTILNEIFTFAQSEIKNGISKEDLLSIAYNSAEFRAVEEYMKKGGKPSDIVFSPPMFCGPVDGPQIMRVNVKYLKVNNSIRKKKWWQF